MTKTSDPQDYKLIRGSSRTRQPAIRCLACNITYLNSTYFLEHLVDNRCKLAHPHAMDIHV